MKIKYIITACILFAVFTMSYAQQSELHKQEQTKITLKGGSILVGVLKSYDPEVGAVLEIAGGDLEISADRIKKIVMMTSSFKENMSKLKTGKVYHRTNVGMLSNANGNGITLNYSALYQHKYWFGIGGGLGIDNYYFQPGRNVYPLFTEIKSYLVDRSSSPYVSIKSGFGFIFPDEDNGQNNTKGGLIFNPTFGYRIGASGIIADLYIGFRFQRAEYEQWNGWGNSRQEIQWNRIETGVALSF